MRTVLIIDDNPGVGEALAVALSLRDIRPLVALTPAQGLALLEAGGVDLVIQDMNFSADTTSGEDGVALFRAIRARHVDVPVVLLTAWTRLESAVELVEAGAADYLAKPWDDARLLATGTRELSRQEVASWKRLIRVISHELKNSLAPISSLAHSGAELARRGDAARAAGVFESIASARATCTAFSTATRALRSCLRRGPRTWRGMPFSPACRPTPRSCSKARRPPARRVSMPCRWSRRC